MTPQGFSDRYSRRQLFTIIAVLGCALVVACAVEFETSGLPQVAVTSVCIFAIATGVHLFGFRSLLPTAIMEYVIRIVGLSDLNVATAWTVRDIVIGSAIALMWQLIQSRRKLNGELGLGIKGFQSVLQAIPDVLLVIDSTGRCREVFTGDEDHLVLPKRDIVGKLISEVVPPNESERCSDAIRKVLSEGKTTYIENKIKNAEEERTFSAKLIPFEYRGKKAVLWASRDISSYKRAVNDQRETENHLRSLIRLQERERKLISCELHDGILQQVIVAHMLSQVLEDEVDGKEAKENLISLQNTLAEAIREGRDLIQELRPIMIDEDNVIDAIRYLVKEEEKQMKAKLSFKSEGDFDDLSPLLESNVFRIIQEALNNARRHSQADEVNVEISTTSAGTLNLRVVDNGVGFDLDTISNERFGLKGIDRRAKLFGGSAQINSARGKGTTISVSMPIERRNELTVAS